MRERTPTNLLLVVTASAHMLMSCASQCHYSQARPVFQRQFICVLTQTSAGASRCLHAVRPVLDQTQVGCRQVSTAQCRTHRAS